MTYGDPLATFRLAALQYRSGNSYGSTKTGKEICHSCKDRIATKLDDFRQVLFNKLPTFFSLKEIDPLETQGR